MGNSESEKLKPFTARLTEENMKFLDDYGKKNKVKGGHASKLRHLIDNYQNHLEDFEARIEVKDKELDDTKMYVNYLEKKVPKNLQSENLDEKEIVAKALGLSSLYVECDDGFPIESHPTWRACRRDPRVRERFIHIPRDKKTGLYIVKNAQVCSRCKTVEAKEQKKDTERKKQERRKRLLEEQKRTIREGQERINRTLAREKTQKTSNSKPDSGGVYWFGQDAY